MKLHKNLMLTAMVLVHSFFGQLYLSSFICW